MNTDKFSAVTATVENFQGPSATAVPPPPPLPPAGYGQGPAAGYAQTGYPAEQYPGQYALNPVYPPGTSYPHQPQIVAPTAVVITYNRGAEPPAEVQCGRCGSVVHPFKRYEPGMFSWLLAGGICLIGCCCFVWVPFVADSTKDSVYTCPKCTQELARVKRI